MLELFCAAGIGAGAPKLHVMPSRPQRRQAQPSPPSAEYSHLTFELWHGAQATVTFLHSNIERRPA